MAGLAGLLVWAGCATAARPVRAEAARAFVVVENHTDFAWRVALTPVTPETPETDAPDWLPVQPREVVKLALTPGFYRAKREIVGAGKTGAPIPTATAGVELTLQAGRTYAWPLATLFSNDEVER